MSANPFYSSIEWNIVEYKKKILNLLMLHAITNYLIIHAQHALMNRVLTVHRSLNENMIAIVPRHVGTKELP